MQAPCIMCTEMGTVCGMARSAKDLEPLDRTVVQVLNEMAEHAGMSRRDLVAATGLGLNRLGIIMRGERPPSTTGELGLIANAFGSSASAVLAEAESRLARTSDLSQADVMLAASDRNDDAEAEAQQEEA